MPRLVGGEGLEAASRTAQRAWMVANGEPRYLTREVSLARYRNPRYTSSSAAADAAMKHHAFRAG